MVGCPNDCAFKQQDSFLLKGVDADSNLLLAHDVYKSPSPEEQIIAQRSRVKMHQAFALKYDNQECELFYIAIFAPSA